MGRTWALMVGDIRADIPLVPKNKIRPSPKHGWGTTQRREWILDELRNRFCTIFATDSWQRTRGSDEWVHKMTNIIHSYRFVKPYIIHNIA